MPKQTTPTSMKRSNVLTFPAYRDKNPRIARLRAALDAAPSAADDPRIARLRAILDAAPSTASKAKEPRLPHARGNTEGNTEQTGA